MFSCAVFDGAGCESWCCVVCDYLCPVVGNSRVFMDGLLRSLTQAMVLHTSIFVPTCVCGNHIVTWCRCLHKAHL